MINNVSVEVRRQDSGGGGGVTGVGGLSESARKGGRQGDRGGGCEQKGGACGNRGGGDGICSSKGACFSSQLMDGAARHTLGM
jgi:hypothetical protein